MCVFVMRIWHMRMAVVQPFMRMGVTMRPHRHGIMRMVVVSITVVVCMFVIDWFMHMRVSMVFHQMQNYAA